MDVEVRRTPTDDGVAATVTQGAASSPPVSIGVSSFSSPPRFTVPIGGPSTPLIEGRLDRDRHWLERQIHRDDTNQQEFVMWSALLPSQEPNGGWYTSPGRVYALRYLSGCAVELMIRQDRRGNWSSGRPAPPPRSWLMVLPEEILAPEMVTRCATRHRASPSLPQWRSDPTLTLLRRQTYRRSEVRGLKC
jgi:hypothetical protein